jgi:2,4-dienoyl-CoA reductase (NADPH2)
MTRGHHHLLSPGRIGTMALRNRIVHAPMSLGLGAGDGTCGDRYIAYYAERAKGGAGLINIGTVSIGYPEGSVDNKQIAASDDRYLPNLRRLAEAIHAHGAKLVLQLNHNGLSAGSDRAAGRPLATPSLPVLKRGDLADSLLPEELAAMAAGNPVLGEIKYEVLDSAGIRRIVEMFTAAAVRCQQAGIDAVEIHGGHGYLLAGFLSPVTNLRTDDYGGSAERRARFLVEVLQSVRAAVGPDFPVWCKIDATEFELDGGITIGDAMITARLAEAAGANAISVSAYTDVAKAYTHSGSHTPQQPELLVPNAIAIKSVVDIPVITAGRIEPAAADRHIAEGHFDFVAFGRKLLADPALPNKLAAGKAETIRPCIYCYSCISQAYFRRPVICTVNPEMGFERELALQPAAAPKRAVVIGGGPNGLEAARRLALAGHVVTLLERSDRLGGDLNIAAVTYEPNGEFLDWLLREVAAAPIDVRLGVAATVERVQSLNPDIVILATGAAPAPVLIAGGDAAAVLTGEALDRVIENRDLKQLGQRIAIIGGGMAGLQIADWLSGNGRSVTVIDAAPKLGAGLPIVRRARVLFELQHNGVVLAPHAADIKINAGEVSWQDSDASSRREAFDQVIISAAKMSGTALAQQLAASGFAVHSAGDCNGPGDLEKTLRDVAELVHAL